MYIYNAERAITVKGIFISAHAGRNCNRPQYQLLIIEGEKLTSVFHFSFGTEFRFMFSLCSKKLIVSFFNPPYVFRPLFSPYIPLYPLSIFSLPPCPPPLFSLHFLLSFFFHLPHFPVLTFPTSAYVDRVNAVRSAARPAFLRSVSVEIWAPDKATVSLEI